MSREAYLLIAPVIAPLVAALAISWLDPFRPIPSFEASSLGPTMGWTALVLGLASMGYSLRKWLFLQGFGSLQGWKAAHVIIGYVFIVFMFAHSNATVGAGARFLLNFLVAGILLTGLWGVVRQGIIPNVMTRTLLDPVYKSELQDDVNEDLKEIADSLEDTSPELQSIYQRHVLPFISIRLTTAEQQKAMLRRLFGPSSADPNAAVRDLAVLDDREKDLFYDIAAKAADVVEIRRSQAYQRKMNNWLVWHIGFTAALGVVLTFHILASFYF